MVLAEDVEHVLADVTLVEFLDAHVELLHQPGDDVEVRALGFLQGFHGQQFDRGLEVVGGARVRQVGSDAFGDGAGFVASDQFLAQHEVYDVDDLELDLGQVGGLLLPPFPAVMFEHFAGLDPYGAKPGEALVAPVVVNPAVHLVL